MFAPSRRHHHVDIWPGFVDAMATLLMVIVFVLMTFVVAQLYLTDALSGKENDVMNLETQMGELQNTLNFEKMSKEEREQEVKKLQSALKLLTDQVHHLRTALQMSEKTLMSETEAKAKAQHTISDLSKQIHDVNEKLFHLNQALETSENLVKNQESTITDLHLQFQNDLSSKSKEMDILEKELAKMKDPKRLGLTQFRSEFFAKLMKIIGDRGDMRIVGDRFVFQSEVLFDKGSADIREQGQAQLKKLAETLREISKKIPKDIQWILRIDGHTDKLPIKSVNFPSNWELSSARAIAVVKFMEKEGISPPNLVAAGFGEHQPLGIGDSEDALSKNRRIEFKLDQR